MVYDPTDEKLVVPAPVDPNADAATLKQLHVAQVRKEALALWASFEAVNRMPDLVYTTEQAEERNTVYGDLEGFVYQQVALFITGERSLDEFDAFRNEVYNYGLEDALKIAQEVLDQTNK